MPSILDRFRLDGQVAIVTGSGRGIGSAIALALADAGADIVVTARSPEEIAQTAKLVRERGVKALTCPCDVLNAEQRSNLVAKALAEFGRLDILVNNAGGWGPKPALATTEAEFEECFRFNVMTAFAMSRLCVPHMATTSGSGTIVNISSVAGTHPQPGFVAYGVGKAALGWMTRNLAQDFAPKVRVNAIAVGATRTAALENFMNEKLEKAILSRTPMGRLGSTEDIAACALYLASPASAYMTGQILNVDGGITATPVEMHRAGL